MNSWLAWAAFLLAVLLLTLVGYRFSLRVLRLVAVFVAIASAVYITWYGLTHTGKTASGLSGAFAPGHRRAHHRAFPRPPGAGRMDRHRRPARDRLPRARSLGPALPGPQPGYLGAGRRPEDRRLGRGRGGHAGPAAARPARRRAQVPAARGGGALTGHLAGRQPGRRAGVDRRGERGPRRRPGRRHHQLLRDAVAGAAAAPGPGLGGTNPWSHRDRRRHPGHRRPRRPADRGEPRDQDAGRERPRRRRLRGGRVRRPAHLRRGPDGPALVHRSDGRPRPGRPPARPAGARLPRIGEPGPPGTEKADPGPGGGGEGPPVRRRGPLRAGAALRPDRPGTSKRCSSTRSTGTSTRTSTGAGTGWPCRSR